VADGPLILIMSTNDSQPHGVVLFDGTCAFCEGAVTFIAARDPAGYFRFGASQSPQASALLARHGLSRDSARSIILLEGDHAYLRSTASLRIAARLSPPWSLARVFHRIPIRMPTTQTLILQWWQSVFLCRKILPSP
jgi:predicted DCC family thiol-disulfide oxidoreductase YuxK